MSKDTASPPDTGPQLIAKVRALQKKDAAEKEVIDRFYGVLTVLDTKATGLLTANSLLMAGITAVLAAALTTLQGHPLQQLAWWVIMTGIVPLLVVGVSSFTCMNIVKMKWPFLHKAEPVSDSVAHPVARSVAEAAAKPTAAGIPEKYDFEFEINGLGEETVARTASYGKAWHWNWWGGIISFGWFLSVLFICFENPIRRGIFCV